MSFLHYLKDKRYTLGLFFILMLIFSLMMFVSTDHNGFGNILYTIMICLFFISLYMAIGFLSKHSSYKEIAEIMESDHWEVIATLPKPKSIEQKQYFELIKSRHLAYSQQLQKLHDEKRDHQDFIMSWIHEVKLPIASSRLLMRNSMGKTVDFLVDKFEDEINKIDNYVEQALYYSRIDSFSKDYFITEVQLNLLIKESLKKYSKLFINKRIRFQLDEVQQFVQSDSKWLAFIIDQIVGNSLKYTGENGEIRFQVEEDSREIRLHIYDTGIGITPEDLNRVFDKGFTGSIGRKYTKSTGMGLYLAKQMALKLGHDLSIQSEESKFTKVTIHFPKIRTFLHQEV